MNAEEAEQHKRSYRPITYIEDNPEIKVLLDGIANGELLEDRFDGLAEYLRYNDRYMVLADFDSYRTAQQTVSEVYGNPMHFARMSLKNIANANVFSADRSVKEYAEKIWRV
jgi:starch phosphorylase